MTLVLVAGIILCGLSFRRPRAIGRCLLSLIILLGGMLLAELPQWLTLPPAEMQGATVAVGGIFRQTALDSGHLPVKGKFHQLGEQLIGQLPAIWERLLLGATASENRTTPFQITVPISMQSDVSLAMPGGY